MPFSIYGFPSDVGWVVRKIESPSDVRRGDLCIVVPDVTATTDVDLWRRVCAEAFTKRVPIVR